MTLRERFESWWSIHCRRLPVEDPKELSWHWYQQAHKPQDEDEEDTEAET